MVYIYGKPEVPTWLLHNLHATTKGKTDGHYYAYGVCCKTTSTVTIVLLFVLLWSYRPKLNSVLHWQGWTVVMATISAVKLKRLNECQISLAMRTKRTHLTHIECRAQYYFGPRDIIKRGCRLLDENFHPVPTFTCLICDDGLGY